MEDSIPDNTAAPDKGCECTHEVIVRGVCLRGGRVLLCAPADGARAYLPGGHIEPGEGARDALVREMREELGLEASAGAFLGAVEHHFGEGEHAVFEINLLFAMELPASVEVPVSAEPWISFFWCDLPALGHSRLEPWPLRTALPRLCHAPATAGELGFLSSYQPLAEKKGNGS